MLEQTLASFDYPNSLVKSYNHWHLLLRPQQTTLGSLILICKEEVTDFSAISIEANKEKHYIIKEVEHVLKSQFNYNKINYLMLMLVDPEVHFHIIPRYEQGASFNGQQYPDPSWGKPPDLSKSININAESQLAFNHFLTEQFSSLSKEQIIPRKKYRRLYTSGCFDIFHQGHLNILAKSKALCNHLIVGVSTDDLILKEKGRLPVIPFEERISIIKALDIVDEAIPQVDKNKQAIVDTYKIDAISVGDDWKGRYPKVTCAMEYFPYTPNVSSTILKSKLNLT
ncbi:adenylyltransferase/cytidyltransferase family protein [Kangiella sp. TOML190]|uniref:adenylyltransferase/cytidyltransferase family protein n=1 Tax=Kangiella sp. TOML190 TaxID=2931351 RepID=UPI002040D439|nr:adenylyltransferase/cytidyltransferase family protein [Kangiella sp. TOML190]